LKCPSVETLAAVGQVAVFKVSTGGGGVHFENGMLPYCRNGLDTWTLQSEGGGATQMEEGDGLE
jgi:hypothetical protein